MDVFVIPRDADKYALYCEVRPGTEEVDDRGATGLFGRLRRYFAVMVREAEAQEDETTVVDSRWLGRLHRRVLRWVVERMAEQRLLWWLRTEATATLVHPADLTFAQAQAQVDRELRRDRDRHRTLLVIFTIAFLASGLVAVVPGPNLIAYYFAFRVVGHYLSLRGALHGLKAVAWVGRACPELQALRDAITLPAADREARVCDVAYQLQLPRLPRFFARVAAGST